MKFLIWIASVTFTSAFADMQCEVNSTSLLGSNKLLTSFTLTREVQTKTVSVDVARSNFQVTCADETFAWPPTRCEIRGGLLKSYQASAYGFGYIYLDIPQSPVASSTLNVECQTN